jgi:hypothetical protein
MMNTYTLEVLTDSGLYFEIDIRAYTPVDADRAALFMFPKATSLRAVLKQ